MKNVLLAFRLKLTNELSDDLRPRSNDEKVFESPELKR